MIPILSAPKPAHRLRIICDDLVRHPVPARLKNYQRKSNRLRHQGGGECKVWRPGGRTPLVIACAENFPLLKNNQLIKSCWGRVRIVSTQKRPHSAGFDEAAELLMRSCFLLTCGAMLRHQEGRDRAGRLWLALALPQVG